MKKPVKKYNDAVNTETEEMFYMCEFIDITAARPNMQEIEGLETQIN